MKLKQTHFWSCYK